VEGYRYKPSLTTCVSSRRPWDESDARRLGSRLAGLADGLGFSQFTSLEAGGSMQRGQRRGTMGGVLPLLSKTSIRCPDSVKSARLVGERTSARVGVVDVTNFEEAGRRRAFRAFDSQRQARTQAPTARARHGHAKKS